MIKFNKFARAERAVKKLIGSQNVLTSKTALLLNSFDGSPVKSLPDAVLEIKDITKLPQLIKILNDFDMPFVPRAAGTNHDGGTIALKGGCVLNLNHLDTIEEINEAQQYALVQCGVVNGVLQKALQEKGFFYAPDPASKEFCTIGGNCALGAGGPKTLKYGATIANILKAQFILPNGEVIMLDRSTAGPDLTGLLLKSEGTLGIISRLWVKITPQNPYKKTVLAYFPSLQDTMLCVRDIIAAGIIPAALEAMDKSTLKAVNAQTNAEALLIIEIDGKKTELAKEAEQILKICKANKAFNIESAADEEHSKALWQKRLSSAATLASLGTGLISLDCAVSRTDLPEIITKVGNIYGKYNLRAGIVFHAGDGNLHPNIAFNEDNLYELNQIKKAVKEVHCAVCELNGTISAEHGIGVEKRAAMALMFDNNILNLFRIIKQTMDPKNISNPDKVLPISSTSEKQINIPQDIIYLIETVKKANTTKQPLNIYGLNTKIKLKGKDNLSLKNLNKIIEIDKTNYTVTAQSGISMKVLQDELGKHNLYLPVSAGKGSLGGDFCTKSSPELKDYVTGLDIILPNGNFLHFGGKYVKNTAGYDLIALMSGSRGVYGIITSLTLRVMPLKTKSKKHFAFVDWTPSQTEIKLKQAIDQNNILNVFYFKDSHEG